VKKEKRGEDVLLQKRPEEVPVVFEVGLRNPCCCAATGGFF